MACCFSTRASVATVLTTHPCLSRCLTVKHLICNKIDTLGNRGWNFKNRYHEPLCFKMLVLQNWMMSFGGMTNGCNIQTLSYDDLRTSHLDWSLKFELLINHNWWIYSLFHGCWWFCEVFIRLICDKYNVFFLCPGPHHMPQQDIPWNMLILVGQFYVCHKASRVTMKDMGKIFRCQTMAMVNNTFTIAAYNCWKVP